MGRVDLPSPRRGEGKKSSPGGEDHDHLLAFHAGLVLDLGHGLEVGLDLLEELHAQLGVGQFAAAEGRGQREELRRAEAVVERALPGVPAVHVRADDDALGRFALQANDQIGGLDLAVATKVIEERANLDIDNVPGDAQVAVLEKIGPVFVELGDVASQQQVDEALETLIHDEFATAADPARFAE